VSALEAAFGIRVVVVRHSDYQYDWPGPPHRYHFHGALEGGLVIEAWEHAGPGRGYGLHADPGDNPGSWEATLHRCTSTEFGSVARNRGIEKKLYSVGSVCVENRSAQGLVEAVAEVLRRYAAAA
jgi:hypothetical protein